MSHDVAKIILTTEQEDAQVRFAKFMEDFHAGKAAKPFFVLSGYAGTGKSFTLKKILADLKLEARFMTYTGKAALVLNKYHNVGATTIHGAIYKLRVVSDSVFRDLDDKRASTNDPAELKAIEDEITDLMKPKFELNESAFDEDPPDVIALDECSMVDDALLQDLVSFGIPIIALGDPGQLPPVSGEGALFRGVPDAMLTEIQRQAADSPIIKWSMWARTKRPLPSTDLDTWEQDEACKLVKSMVSSQQWAKMAEEHDVIICWKNVTRMNINKVIRRARGLDKIDNVFPVKGETIIFTKNDKEVGVFNGMFAEVTEVHDIMDNYLDISVRPETFRPEDDPIRIKMMRAPFEKYYNPDIEKTLRPWDYAGKQQADFGYAITCHKAQGSQWEKVLIVEENVFNWHKGDAQDQRARWLYTAITRAILKFTMLAGK